MVAMRPQHPQHSLRKSMSQRCTASAASAYVITGISMHVCQGAGYASHALHTCLVRVVPMSAQALHTCSWQVVRQCLNCG